MKWIGTSRSVKALAVSLAMGLGMTACSRDYTLAYVYVTSATRTTTGEINAYAVDYETGALQQLPDSPVASGGSNPVTLVATPNGQYVYVLNHDTSTVVQFDVGTDGKLYPENTYNVVQGSGATGSFPTAAAVDPSGTHLYVTFTYQNGFTTASPGPGGVAVFPINSDGSLGTPVANGSLPYYKVGFAPVGVVASAYNNFLYVVEQDTATTNGVSASQGTIVAFSIGGTSAAPTGALTPVPGTISVAGTTGVTGFPVGTKPSAIVEDPSARFVYVTDQLTNSVYGFLVGNGGALQSMVSSPFATGSFPLGATIDPRGLYLYTANFGDGTVSNFAISTATGSLSGGGVGFSAQTGPTCVTIEPARGIYMYTSNNEDSSVSAIKLNASTGGLTGVQGTPYTAQPLPTCAVAVAIGSHASQLVPAT